MYTCHYYVLGVALYSISTSGCTTACAQSTTNFKPGVSDVLLKVNLWSNTATAIFSSSMAKCWPIQILDPDPNGIYMELFSELSDNLRNRNGWKSFGNVHCADDLCIPHVKTRISL